MIYIIIPVFNRWTFTEKCLESLMNQTYKAFVVVVVDHGSTDNTSLYIKEQYPNVVLLNGTSEMWWTAATNVGIRYALENGSNYIITLNNDTLPTATYLEEVSYAIKKKPNALIGASAFDATNNKPIYLGENLNWFKETSTYYPLTTNRPENGLLKVSHFPGRGLCIPRIVFEKIGFFDEIVFPHYMADYDFTLKAIRAGFEIYCAFDARIGIFPAASGANEVINAKSFDGYKKHLFGIKGGGNLPLFYKYALRNCPLYALPSHLLIGTFRRLLGYWVKS